MPAKTTARPYSSAVRAASAAEKRQRVVSAATCLLREEGGITAFSLDAVAKTAGVTRLTVYNQFGSRRGLLEVVFDEIARHGGLTRITAVMALDDANDALQQVVQIFCDFWASDPAIDRLHDAMALDAEFAVALTERNEWRRKLMHTLVERLFKGQASPKQRRDTVDLLHACTSHAMYRMLNAGRSPAATSALVMAACRAALQGCVAVAR